jgi:hypothetical protein
MDPAARNSRFMAQTFPNDIRTVRNRDRTPHRLKVEQNNGAGTKLEDKDYHEP